MSRVSAILMATMLAALAGCAPATPTAVPPPVTVPTTADDRQGPDEVRVYTDGGAATSAIVGAMRSARATLDAEIYELGRPDIIEAMTAAVSRGVRVRVVGDPTVDVTSVSGRRLAMAGAEVTYYPVGPRQIDHVKLLVVDARVAYFGGVNWGAHSYLNRDYEVRMLGPAVQHLSRLFALDMNRSGRQVAIPPAPPVAPGEPEILTSNPDDDIGRAVLAALASATRSVVVESFVLTDRGTIAALMDARHRGLFVRVLFDPGQDLNQSAMAQLRSAGIACRFYRSSGEKLHAKTAVIDGNVLVIGSANWTASGFRHNHELDTLLHSATLAAAVRLRMDQRWAAAA
ncbi:MAG: phosphatidylserine/phosphatidylglycerophosphate/cardiolipin synthase family protein [Candidatus Dormibacteria bacterium]